MTDLPARPFAAFLFDMDGTLLTSIASAERVWGRWAQTHGLDVAAFLPTIHGVRSVETIRRLGLPGVDPVAEAAAITAAELADVAGLPAPPRLIAAEDVATGKPAPDCFRLAATRLGVAAADCLVFEDAPAGIAAAEAADMAVVILTATHAHPIATSHPTLPDYAGLTVRTTPEGLVLAPVVVV